MALIGMQHVVAAKVATETEGAALTYDAGMVVGKAISANLSWERPDNPLYADDAIAENDNGITGGTLEIGVDDLTDGAKEYLYGLTKTEGTSGTPTIYHHGDNATPYLGVGYVRVRRKNGVTSYEGYWLHKVQMAEESEEAQTRGQNIEWQTPTLNGRIFGVKNDATLNTYYYDHGSFESLAAAVAWVDGKAGI